MSERMAGEVPAASVTVSKQRLGIYLLISVTAGALTTLAFAPFHHIWLVFATQALAFTLWQQLKPIQAWFSGWVFGIGLQCSGAGWIYYSLHVHGGTHPVFAALIIFLLACYLSIYTGFAAYVVNRFCPKNNTLRMLFFYPAAWVVFEWTQGYVMTGFAWMQTGYTQIDLPLSGFAPLLGNHAVGGLVAMSAGAIALIAQQFYYCFIRVDKTSSNESVPEKNSSQQTIKDVSVYTLKILFPIMLIWVIGYWVKPVSWTQAQGEPIKVSIIQGNIPQSVKWRKDMRLPTLERYRKLTLAQDRDVDLIIWPETAVPDFWYRVQPFVREMKQAMQARNTDLLFGIFVKNDNRQLLNSVLSVNGDVYNKRHLVPLGEFIPLRFLIDFFRRWVDIPMSDIASGSDDQPLLHAAGIPLGISICFEEAFSRDVLITLPEAQLLVNVSNDAWFEDSHESYQHHEIARMRALETGRYMVRSTNTGISSIIGPHGEVLQQAPHFQVTVLTGEVQAMTGATPYVLWGDYLILLICGSLLVFCVAKYYTSRSQEKPE